MRYPLIALLASIALSALPGQRAGAADDATYRLMKLEQDVRNLERQVQTLTRQLDELRQRLSRAGGDPSAARPSSAATTEPSTAWLEAARWDRVRVGMSELQVIDLLGPPTSMRPEGDARVLLYALEIGASGFLSGSVALKERVVVEVHKPVLK
jgi:hypothetical protein